MKISTLFLYVILTATVVVSSCKKEPVAEAVYTIELNDCATVAKNLTICFDSLVEDSRCPSDVECIWQGVAIAKFSLHQNSHIIPFYLATGKVNNISQETIVNGVKISLQDISPYPAVHNPSEEAVKAILKVN